LHLYRKGKKTHKSPLMEPLDRALFKIDNGDTMGYVLDEKISSEANGEPGDFKTEVMLALYLLTYQK
jgi:hypothetical protein